MGNFNWAEESSRLWDEKSNFWNSRSQEMWENGSRKEIIPFFQKFVDEQAMVCDLGCGDGYGSLKLAQSGYAVTGVDFSEEMVHKATLLNSENNSKFIKGDMAELPFSENQFDAAMAINSLEWTEHPLKVLKEIQRIVNPGGKACIGILGPTAAPRVNSYRRLYGEQVVCNTMMPWEFEQLATENHWRKISEFGVYKRESEQLPTGSLSSSIRQAISFMWVFMLENIKE
ncbi:class I SAM-dependent methyltransferase [Cytobacillus sp. FJAT-54145]|uniref:Class I SAM-dependent methyltransferase n=1 Tax=Cytobacillus spartinae TaxID=3299023 RepID=A0ABW6KD06_9BACI